MRPAPGVEPVECGPVARRHGPRAVALDGDDGLEPGETWRRARAGAGEGLDLTAALERCRDGHRTPGIEVLVLDQTQPDIGLPVVKVIAPGLRHFWPRFGPGRLYDVPVRLGRLRRPRAEHELTQTFPVT